PIMNITHLIATTTFGLFIATSAFADGGVAYVTAAKPEVRVLGNGQSYTQITNSGKIAITGKLQFDTGFAGRIKSWQAYPKIRNGYGIAATVPATSFYKQSASYPIGQRPKSINRTLQFGIPASILKDRAVGMCNTMAHTLRKQGKSNQVIFSKDREVYFEIGLAAQVDSNGPNSNKHLWEYSKPKELKVICSKWSGAQIDTIGGISAQPKPSHGNHAKKRTQGAQSDASGNRLRAKIKGELTPRKTR
ncbi:MAG: hypothetical protein AAFU69_01220, partial [Pseudomonadota bacterium]